MNIQNYSIEEQIWVIENRLKYENGGFNRQRLFGILKDLKAQLKSN